MRACVVVALLCSLVAWTGARAQAQYVEQVGEEEWLVDLFRPRLDLALEGTAARDLDPPPGRVEDSRARVDLVLPLGRLRLAPDSRFPARQLFLSAGAETRDVEIGLPPREARFIELGARVTGVGLTTGGKLVAASLGASTAEEEDAPGSADVRGVGFVLVAHPLGGGRTRLLYGGAATYAFGDRAILPIIGVHLRGEVWSGLAAIPLGIRAGRGFGQRHRLELFALPAGQRYRIGNEGTLPGAPEEIRLEWREGHAGAEYRFAVGDRVALFVRGSVVGGRLEWVDDANDDAVLLRTDLDPGTRWRVGLRWTFGRSILDEFGRDLP